MSAAKLHTTITTRQIAAREYPCGDCNRATMTEANGVLVVKAYHGGDIHPNAYMMKDLIKEYISRAGVQQLNEIEQSITTRLSELGVLGVARNNNSDIKTRLA